MSLEKSESAEPRQSEARSTPSAISTVSSTRLHVIIAGLWLSLFISAIDGTIITTALLKISSGFNALDRAAWLVTAYLLTYNSFIMLTAKFSDVWGLKNVMLTCNAIFLIFSMACGGSQSMVQMIVFRAFQGIGGSGCYSLTFVAIMKLITPEKMGFYSGVISSVFALANLLGPILGGVIVDNTTWRWIFFINGPIVATALVLLFTSMPGLKDGKSNKDRVRSFDFLGGILSVCWPVPLLFALQEGGAHYEWDGGVIIGTLTTGLALFLIFGAYEAWITYRTKREAVFPFRFITNPSMALLMLSMFLLGMPFYTAIIQLPQRFQSVNFKSAERAGVLLLPVTLMTPVGAMFAGLVMGKKIAAEYILIISTALTSVGVGLLSSLPTDAPFWVGTYGYQVITGIGLGLASPPYYFLLYTSVEERDASVGTGALNMARSLGGCVAVAICSALHHSSLQNKLPRLLNPEQIALVEDSSAYVSTLPPEVRNELGQIFGQSYNRQFQVIMGFVCLNFVVTVILGVVRKKKGIFGVIPNRTQDNEFQKVNVEGNSDEKEVAQGEKPKSEEPVVNTSEAQEKGKEGGILEAGKA